jgi:carboxypeptidase-like protein
MNRTVISALAILLCGCNRYETVPASCDKPEPIVQSNITWRPRDSTGVVSGLAVDARSLRPVSGALMEIKPGHHGAVSDRTGSFHIDSISHGAYELLVRRIGYAPGRMRFDMSDSAGIELSVQMQQQLLVLDGCGGHVMVQKRKPWWKP